MKKLDYLVDRIAPRVSGLPTPVILQHIYASAREFCEKGDVWRDYTDAIDIKPNNQFLDINLQSGVEIFRIKEVIVDGQRLQELTNEQALNYDSNYFNLSAVTGDPRYYVMVSADNVVLTPMPDKEVLGKTYVYASLRPSYDNGVMPTDILNEYDDVICDGALKMLYLMKGEPFFDIELSRFHARRFVVGTTQAKSSATAGNKKTGLKLDYSMFSF